LRTLLARSATENAFGLAKKLQKKELGKRSKTMLRPVQVTFRNVNADAGLEKLVQQESDKLERFYERITSCRVMVERPQRAQSSKLYHVRIDLRLPRGELVVEHMPSLHAALKDVKAEKSRREAEAVLGYKSPRRAIRAAVDEMTRRLQDYKRRQESAVKTSHKMAEATVREIFPDEGYGFLETEDDRQIYFNEAGVLDGRFGRLRLGTRVRFAEETGDKGPQASTVKVIHPRKQAHAAEALAVFPHGSARNA